MSAAKKIILIPSDQITAKSKFLNRISNYQAKVIIVSSINTNQSPRFNKKSDNSFFVFLLPTRKAEMPAKKLNAGAQKCVTHLVR